jgi:hypothetical protein
MADDKKNYELKAETGYYKVVGGSSNLVANSAIIAANSIISFGHDFVVVPPTEKPKTVAAEEHWPRGMQLMILRKSRAQS